MTKYKQVNDLTDSEKYEVRTYVEAAESTDREQEILDSDANNENEEHDVDPNMTYAITSDEETVTIHDVTGKAVFQTTMEDWEENREFYYTTYRLGSS